jgi:hypothetical protein
MTVLPVLRAQVLAAATTRAQAVAPARRPRRRLRAGLLAFGAIAVTGTALAATGAWSPQVGDDHRGHPTISASSVPGDQLAHFGVLRRPATDADHGEKVRYALRYLDARSFAGVRTDAVRLISTQDNGYVLIPTEEATLGGQAAAAGAPPDNSLCVFAIDSSDGGGLSCWTTEQILAGKAVLYSTKMAPLTPGERAAVQKAGKEAHGKAFTAPVRPRTTGEVTLAGLVPDGVATVEAGAARVRVPVADNFFVAHVTEGGVGSAPFVRWLNADGKDITPR